MFDAFYNLSLHAQLPLGCSAVTEVKVSLDGPRTAVVYLADTDSDGQDRVINGSDAITKEIADALLIWTGARNCRLLWSSVACGPTIATFEQVCECLSASAIAKLCQVSKYLTGGTLRN